MTPYHTFSVGAIRCTALLDFARERTPRATFPRVDPAEIQKEINAGGYDLELDRPMPLYGVNLLLETEGQKVLIDAGLPSAAGGQLVESLAAAGHAPEEIDIVVVTHGDFDHIGGLANYDQARIVMLAAAYRLWTEDTEGMVEEFVKLFRGEAPAAELEAQATGRRAYYELLQGLQAAGRITLVDPGEAIITGVSLRPAPGHRRDHALVEIQSAGDLLLHVADAFRHPLQLKRPDFYSLFDSYPQQLAETMAALFAEAAARDATVFGAHFNFPALIKIKGTPDGYEWLTI